MKTVFIFTQSNRGLTQKYLTLTKVFCILHEKPWGSHPSWDQFGHHGKQKIYLLPKIVVKVANWLQIWKKIEKSIVDWLNYHTSNDTAWSVLPLISQFFFGNQIVIYGNHFADEGCQKVTFWKRDLGALSDHMFSKNVNKVPFPGPWMP